MQEVGKCHSKCFPCGWTQSYRARPCQTPPDPARPPPDPTRSLPNHTRPHQILPDPAKQHWQDTESCRRQACLELTGSGKSIYRKEATYLEPQESFQPRLCSYLSTVQGEVGATQARPAHSNAISSKVSQLSLALQTALPLPSTPVHLPIPCRAASPKCRRFQSRGLQPELLPRGSGFVSLPPDLRDRGALCNPGRKQWSERTGG